MLTTEFFASLGRMNFQFAATEELIALAIIEVSNIEDEARVFRRGFEDKLKCLCKKLRQAIAKAKKTNPDAKLNEDEIGRMIDVAIEIGRRRNRLIHGVLNYDPDLQRLVMRDRAHGGVEDISPASVDAFTAEIQRINKEFGDLRGCCQRVRRYLNEQHQRS